MFYNIIGQNISQRFSGTFGTKIGAFLKFRRIVQNIKEIGWGFGQNDNKGNKRLGTGLMPKLISDSSKLGKTKCFNFPDAQGILKK